ncbi:MAG: hypothetical protein Q9163_003064 [Psora crenata]
MWSNAYGALIAPSLIILAYAPSTKAWEYCADGQNGTNTAAGPDGTCNSLPVVDLGYSLYRATSINTTGSYYNFSNIRFAAPPLGNLRFREPAPPLLEDRSKVNNGTLGYICPQSGPGYFLQAIEGLGSLAAAIPPGVSGQGQSEDCLFLDVISPVKVFQQGQSRAKQKRKLAPVLVNIHGGGFFSGDKTTIYNPTGLLERSNNGFVYVSMNYRLAAFGFLSHLEESNANETSPNAGLLDQRFALKWVQQYIHLFGGDAKQVTITGESAGGGSVEHHSVAYGGAKPEENHLFIRGIAQSPAPIITDPKYASLGANLFLEILGVASVDEARKLSTEPLQAANIASQLTGPFGVEYFAPTVDGALLPDIPSRLYNEGRFIRNIDMMAAYNANEGRLFGNESVRTDADFEHWVYATFPSAPPEVVSYIINHVYPPRYDGSLPYTTPLGRVELASKEYLISCNSYSIAQAYQYQVHNYIFSIPPAIHAQDLAYTYYPTGATPGFYPDIAVDLQGYLTQFVLTGDPNRRGLPPFPEYTQQARVLNFTADGVQEARDNAANDRCEYLLQGTYSPPITRPRAVTSGEKL